MRWSTAERASPRADAVPDRCLRGHRPGPAARPAARPWPGVAGSTCNPLDVTDADAMGWLTSWSGPSTTTAGVRLRHAIEVARRRPARAGAPATC